MKIKEYKVLSIAVASGKTGFVFMVDGVLMDWGMSHAAAATPGNAKSKAYVWIRFYRPSVVVIEQQHKFSRKGKRVHAIVEAIAAITTAQQIPLTRIIREQGHQNKYEEIDALCEDFPKNEAWAPHKRTAFESETRETIIFEALAMAIQYLECRNDRATPPGNLPV